MGIVLQFNPHNSPSFFSTSHNFKNPLKSSKPTNNLSFSRIKKLKAVETAESEATPSAIEEQNPGVDFAFVSSVLLPDGTPDVHYRTCCGGQKLRDIMLDNNIELYGPYARPLCNCAGGGTCGTCIVEHPKNWRLACQATVGKPDSRGLVVIQQLPEWKAHEWTYGKEPPEDDIVYV
ncbi:hypothetical protein DH2020_041187 [Rehmannia glutinosa]|uniref:2Fe-2S ferredoxin-type domain-containing protein n=1 Tax=Rehmannia glutinosa TaxID=99300 RepID=A0ABR0US14_REHGL